MVEEKQNENKIKEKAAEQFEELEGVVEGKKPKKRKGLFEFAKLAVERKQKIVKAKKRSRFDRRKVKLKKKPIRVAKTQFLPRTFTGLVPVVNRGNLRRTIPVRGQREKINRAFGKNLRNSINPFKKVLRRK